MAVTKLEKARAQLSLAHPFFSSILFKRPLRITDKVPIAAVTPCGEILFNPSCEKEYEVDQLIFVLAHEVLHVVFSHALRKGKRDALLWNIAGDAVINETLVALGVGRPLAGCVRHEGAENMTTEQVYDLYDKNVNGDFPVPTLPDDQRDVINNGDGAAGLPDDNPLSEAAKEHGVTLSKDAADMEEARNKMDTAEAHSIDRMTNKARGDSHGSFMRRIEELLKGDPLPWYEQLHRYMISYTNQGVSWRRPNKRYSDCYMPVTDRVPTMGRICIGIDTSGSISERELGYFKRHITDLIEDCKPSHITVVYCDSEIAHVDEFTLDDELTMEPHGGGGTDMTEIVTYVEDSDEPYDVTIIFTDGYTPYKDSECDVIWVLTTDYEAPSYCNVLRFKIED